MEETISTTSDVATEQTTPSVETTTEQTTEQETETTVDVQSDVEQPSEPEQTTDETESVGTETQPKNWEKIAKDNQASYTKVSQELAELKKQIEAQRPKVIDETGKVTPEYESKCQHEADNREFLNYYNASRYLPTREMQTQVEELLGQAQSLYNPKNKYAYEQKMSEVKNYFDSNTIEQIAFDKRNYQGQIKSKFDEMAFEQKKTRANQLAEEIGQTTDLRELVTNDSENYSPEVFGIVKQMFDLTGGIDVETTNNAIRSIKALGVKEYLANQKVQAQKQKAVVPTSQPVAQVNSDMPSAEVLRHGGDAYIKAVKKYGMAKVDEIIMKG